MVYAPDLCALAVLFTKTLHFWQSFPPSVFSVSSCSSSLVAACRAASLRLCVEAPPPGLPQVLERVRVSAAFSTIPLTVIPLTFPPDFNAPIGVGLLYI